MRWFVLAFVLLICLFLALLLAGAMLPVKHQVTGEVVVNKTPNEVWALISDPEQQPKWRSDVTRVERLPDRDGHEVWREYYKNGQKLSFETTARDPLKRLVRHIVDERAFGGEWEITLEADPSGTKVRVIERGEVYNPLFRFVSRFIIGHDKSIRDYLADLKNKS